MKCEWFKPAFACEFCWIWGEMACGDTESYGCEADGEFGSHLQRFHPSHSLSCLPLLPSSLLPQTLPGLPACCHPWKSLPQGEHAAPKTSEPEWEEQAVK